MKEVIILSKKKYLVVALGVVSVLLGSLLYSSLVLAGDVTPSGKPQPQPTIYKDAVQIDLRGGCISTETSPHANVTLPFTFNPKGQHFNATRMWISFQHGGNLWYSIIFTLNQATTITHNYFIASSASITSFEADTSFCGAIADGINLFTISELYRDSVTPTTETITYMVLFIEYEYQA